MKGGLNDHRQSSEKIDEMFYNNNRRHSYLDYLSPKEFEKVMTISVP